MSLVLATEKTVVRSMCAGPDDTELPDDDLELCFTVRALAWINKRRPQKAITSFATIANQQDYDEKPATALKVTRVWWLNSTWMEFSPTMVVVPGSMDLNEQFSGMSTIDNPEMVTNFYKRINYYRQFFTGRGLETANGKIRLIPAPNSKGDAVFFEYSYPLTDIEDVQDQYVDAVRNIAASYAMEFLATKRSVIVSTRNFRGGAGKMEKAFAKNYRDEAESQAPIVGGVFVG